MKLLLPLAIAAQMTDAVTLDWSIEANPVVLFLGSPWAYVLKAAVILWLIVAEELFPGPATRAVLAFAILIGAFGAWSNVR